MLFSDGQFISSDDSPKNNQLFYNNTLITKASEKYYIVFVLTYNGSVCSVWAVRASNTDPYCKRLSNQENMGFYSEIFFSSVTGALCVKVVGGNTSINCRVLQINS